MEPANLALLEILKVVVLGPVTVLVGSYAWHLHKLLRESEKQLTLNAQQAEQRRVADLQIAQGKLETLIDKFYSLMMKQGESLEAFDSAIREHTREFVDLRGSMRLLTAGDPAGASHKSEAPKRR
jgi:hypothetical protein